MTWRERAAAFSSSNPNQTLLNKSRSSRLQVSLLRCSAFSDAFCHVCITAKPGECPPQTSGSSCTVSCNSDSNCPNNEKCCSNGCGRYCTAPYTVKPGQCPKPKRVPECAESCFHDGQCPATQKCCPTTCGHVCMLYSYSFFFPCSLKPFRDFLSTLPPSLFPRKKK
uniref:WAP domain-containing protein n=1 Tax=Cyprinus carpio TaxID=7962 RepID=A0A8C1S5Y9_CYPCA